MLIALMGGTARPASELARIAGIAASTATSHLQRLEGAGLVIVRAQGRHRYYALAGPTVARAVESLATCAPATSTARRKPSAAGDAPALARTCYGHLAGRLAIAFWTRAAHQQWIRWSDVAVTLLPRGRDALAEGELLQDAGPLSGSPCLDWSERVNHVSGPLGIALCEGLLRKAWVARIAGSRALRVTARGEERLQALGVRWV